MFVFLRFTWHYGIRIDYATVVDSFFFQALEDEAEVIAFSSLYGVYFVDCPRSMHHQREGEIFDLNLDYVAEQKLRE